MLSSFRKIDLSLSNENRVVLFIDEIQISPEAISSLKFLSYQKYLTVIASGSLLGTSENSANLFPVGYVDIIRMYPLDFEEFLWAQGYTEKFIDSLCSDLKNGKGILQEVHKELLQRFREFIYVGGLPENVKIMKENGVYSSELQQNQYSLYQSYFSDIAKYAPKDVRIRGQELFKSLPSCLARENNKFVYSAIKKGARGNEYRSSLSWLIDAGIVLPSYNLDSIQTPFSLHKKSSDFKLYLFDTGILISMMGGMDPGIILNNSTDMNKGVIYENAAAVLLSELGVFKEKDLYFYARLNGLKIDFALETNKKPYLVEIKSSDNTKSKSLSYCLHENKDLTGIRISSKRNGISPRLITLPHYALSMLYKIID